MKVRFTLAALVLSIVVLFGCGTDQQNQQPYYQQQPVPPPQQQPTQQLPYQQQPPIQQGPQQGPMGPQNPMMGPQGPIGQGPQGPMMGPNGPQNPMMGPQAPQNPMMGPQGQQFPAPVLGQPVPYGIPPMNPNPGYLPPMGQPISWQQYPTYFQGLQNPYTQQPVFAGPDANLWARRCYNRGIDLRQFNDVYHFFATVQYQQNTSYYPLCNGRMAVRITTAIFEQYGSSFNVTTFQNCYNRCLAEGYVGYAAIQQAFTMMNVRINVQEFII